MDLAKAQEIIDDRTHPDWLAAYQAIQWDTIWRADPQTLNAELVDWDEPERDAPDDDEDFTVDDGLADAGPAYGCDGGAYFVEANSGPGWVYSGATNVPRPTSP